MGCNEKNMKNLILFKILIGCTPKNRLTEQHDVFFGIANSLQELVNDMRDFWPEANGKIHIDCWREVNQIENYSVTVHDKSIPKPNNLQLFFINLGGYLPNEFEEYHYKTLLVAESKAAAIKKVKQTDFYKKFSFKGATSHVDDNYGVDIDDIFEIEDILAPKFKINHHLHLTETENMGEDSLHIGYLKIEKLLKSN